MKKLKLVTIFAFVTILLNVKTNAQTTPNIPGKFPTEYGTFTFALGSKILLELKELDSSRFEYKVLSVEPVEGFYSFKEN